MNKKHLGIVALFILCFSFALAGKSAQAATTPQETSVSKIAYVDASGRLVLKFADFSDAGYTYTVTNEKTGAKTDTAQLASKKVLASFILLRPDISLFSQVRIIQRN